MKVKNFPARKLARRISAALREQYKQGHTAREVYGSELREIESAKLIDTKKRRGGQ